MSKCGEAGKKSRREEGRVNGLHGTNLLLDGLLLPFEFSFLIVVTICFMKIIKSAFANFSFYLLEFFFNLF